MNVAVMLLCSLGGFTDHVCAEAPDHYRGRPFDHWLRMARDEDAVVRSLAMEVLMDMDAGANHLVPAIAKTLVDGEQPYLIRFVLCCALSHMGDSAKGAVPALMEAFRGPDPRLQVRAARTLGDIGSAAVPAAQLLQQGRKSAEGALVACLDYALFRINGDADAFTRLRRSLSDDEPDTRAAAANVLAALGKRSLEAVPDLVTSLKDDSPEVRCQAASALGKVGTGARSALPSLRTAVKDADLASQIWLHYALFQIERDPESMGFLTEALNVPDGGARRMAAAALEAIGPAAEPAIPTLIEVLKDDETLVSRAAADALVLIQGKEAAARTFFLTLCDLDSPAGYTISFCLAKLGPAAVPAIAKMLNHRKYSDRAIAMLTRIGPPAVPALQAALETLDEDGRREAAEALNEIERQAYALATVAELQGFLKDNAPRVRTRVVEALGEYPLRGRPAVPLLADALRDPAPEVRRAAVLALKETGRDADPAVDALAKLVVTDKCLDIRLSALASIERIDEQGTRAIPAFRALLGGQDPINRISVNHALLKLALDPEAIPPLLTGLEGKDPLVRAFASMALADAIAEIMPFTDVAFVDAVSDVADDASRDSKARKIRPQIVAARATLKAAVGSLSALLQDEQRDVCWCAAKALGHMGKDAEPAIPGLLGSLRHPDPAIRLESAGALGDMWHGGDAAVPGLVAALGDLDAQVRVRIAEALRKICRQAELAVPGLQRLLMDKDGRVRSAAASALAGFRSQAEPAVPTLIAIVREGDRYAEDDAVMALGCVGPPAKAAVPVLIEALKRTGDLGLPDVVNALGSIGPDARDAVPALQALLRRESEYVRSAVRSALNNICPEPEEHSMPNEVTAAAAFLDRDLKGGQPSAPRGPQSPDPPGEPTYEGKTLAQWVAQLNSQDDGAREEAIDAIGRFGRKASVAVPALERLAKDENELIRVAAQEALKVIRGAK